MKIEASGELQTQAHEHACIHTRVQIYAYIYIRKFKINNKAKISEFWNLSTNVTQENVQHKLCLNHPVKVTALDMILHLLQSTNNFKTHAKSTRAS